MDTNSEQGFTEKEIHKIFDNFMNILIAPELLRRQEAGELPKPLKISYAQVILFPDGRKPQVRVNEEVRALCKIKYKDGIVKKVGEPVFDHEIERIEKVELSPDEDPDCAHVFLALIGGSWFLYFDFRRNEAMSLKFIKVAKEFYNSAEFSLQQGNLAAFVDNLFSAAELSAKAVLLVMYDYKPSLRVKASHPAIQLRYNRFANLGNVLPEYKQTFNKLPGLRDAARYLKRPLNITDKEAHKMLDIVRKMIEDAEVRSC